MDKQPEALRLADALDSLMGEETVVGAKTIDDAASELRRLYALNAELLEALQKIKHHFDTDEYAWEVADAAIAKAKEQT